MTGQELSADLVARTREAEKEHLADLLAQWRIALERAADRASVGFALVAQGGWQPPPEGAVLTAAQITALAAALNKRLLPIWRAVLTDVATGPLATIGITWDGHHPLFAGQIDQAAQRTGERLGLAVQDVLRKTIAEAYATDLGIRETTAAIRTAITDAAPWQADALARTDLNSLANGASKNAAQLAGMGYKTWLATLDDRTRPEHADADGQTVPMADTFTVGGEDADYPGDPALSDAMAMNCRCTLTYSESLGQADEGITAGGGTMEQQEMMAAMPSGMDSLPTGVKACSMNGTPGYTGGGACHMHDGTDAGMRTAIRKAQGDASKAKAALIASPRPITFTGVATVEGKIADDNAVTPRVILPNALSWPEMPVSFMAQTVTAEGHDGAEVAGRIDSFTRVPGAAKSRQRIETAGELTTPFGINEIGPMLDDKTMRYVSVDIGATEWAIVNRSTLKVVPEADLNVEDLMGGKYALGATSGKIKALTLVPTQAIEGALVSLTASADGSECTVTVPVELSVAGPGLLAAAAPVRPPRLWFETPEPPGKMPLTISDDGRVFGHLATWDSCHVSFLPSCVPPPKSPSNYAYFHVSELDLDDGDVVTVGKLMWSPTDGGHADRRLTAQRASEHYDKTGMAAAFLRVTDGEHGIWACGSINPTLSDEQRQGMRRELRLNPPSGDWRPINGKYELICGLAVAVPGFPVPRATMTIVASGEEVEIEDAIIASSGVIEPDPLAVAALERDGLLDHEDADADRKIRVLAARAAGGLDAMAALVKS